MPGAKLNRRYRELVQQIANNAHTMGARGPDPDRTPLGSAKADMSLNDQLDAVARAVFAADGVCCVEDVYAETVVLEVFEAGRESYWRASYTQDTTGAVTLAPRDTWEQVEQIWLPVSAATKAGALPTADSADPVVAAVKALGDRTMELRVAWGYDNHREQFHPSRTDFDLENFPAPPVAYYHGYTEDGRPAPKPVYIGKTLKRENRADGHYLTVKLNQKPEADKVWQAALTGGAYVSPGTAAHLRRKDPDGTLTYWPIVEISAWDGAPSRKQAHPRSTGFPVLKALYLEAGLDVPAPLAPPEAAGDAASVAAIDPDLAAQTIAQTVADVLLTLRKGTS